MRTGRRPPFPVSFTIQGSLLSERRSGSSPKTPANCRVQLFSGNGDRQEPPQQRRRHHRPALSSPSTPSFFPALFVSFSVTGSPEAPSYKRQFPREALSGMLARDCRIPHEHSASIFPPHPSQLVPQPLGAARAVQSALSNSRSVMGERELTLRSSEWVRTHNPNALRALRQPRPCQLLRPPLVPRPRPTGTTQRVTFPSSKPSSPTTQLAPMARRCLTLSRPPKVTTATT